MSPDEIKTILADHAVWLLGRDGGKRANLIGANLIGADLRGADLRGANLREAIYDYLTVGFNLACPEVGSFHAFKKCQDGLVVELFVPETAKRSSATTRKIRFSEALVVAISDGSDFAVSMRDPNFHYRVGETVRVDDFDDDRWNECSRGIHGFLTRHEAEMWEQ